MGIHLNTFTKYFAYDCPNKEGACWTNFLKASSYVPCLAQISYGIVLAAQSAPPTKAERNALKARIIISLSGFGFLLIPVDFIGTIIKMAYCHCRCKKSKAAEEAQEFDNSREHPALDNEDLSLAAVGRTFASDDLSIFAQTS